MSITGKVYQGNPEDIIIRLSQEMADVLGNAGIRPSGVHIIALLHLAANMAKIGSSREDFGKMPSFQMVLSTVTHGMTSSAWTKEELSTFTEEFCQIIESLGGGKLSEQDIKVFISPMLPGIH